MEAMNKPRVVVCAANFITTRQGEDVIVCGARHFDSIMNPILKQKDWVFCEQGFIDQFGVFMTRKEAYEVAKVAGQIRYRCGGDDECLYSENLY